MSEVNCFILFYSFFVQVGKCCVMQFQYIFTHYLFLYSFENCLLEAFSNVSNVSYDDVMQITLKTTVITSLPKVHWGN